MQYMFGILIICAICFYGGAEVGKWLKKRNTKKKIDKAIDEEFHTPQQKDFFKGSMDYRGRKTEGDWKKWYSDILNKDN